MLPAEGGEARVVQDGVVEAVDVSMDDGMVVRDGVQCRDMAGGTGLRLNAEVLVVEGEGVVASVMDEDLEHGGVASVENREDAGLVGLEVHQRGGGRVDSKGLENAVGACGHLKMILGGVARGESASVDSKHEVSGVMRQVQAEASLVILAAARAASVRNRPGGQGRHGLWGVSHQFNRS